MRLRLSRFNHLIPVAADRVLVIDAVSHVRVVVKKDFADLIESFRDGREVESSEETDALLQSGILTDKTVEEEQAEIAAMMGPLYGRDPNALLDRYRRQAKKGPEPYWSVVNALGAEDFKRSGHSVDLLVLGECDVHMEADFLRREAAARGVDLKIAATSADDVRLAGEHKHDVILIGALRSRYWILEKPAPGVPHHAAFITEARKLIEGLRQHSAAPILIDALPEPTLQPLGLSERGTTGHRNRFRIANMALADLVEKFRDVHVVDIPAVLGAVGAERLVDDGQIGFGHLGSPGWMLQRPDVEKAAVHNIVPDMTPLAEAMDGDPYIREAITARAHMDAIVIVLGLDRKKCVIVDLDGVLWPGVLAETGSPFAWSEEVSSTFSYIGLYFGLHEALLALKRRGILLACVSKNDEATVRALWKYGAHYPTQLLRPEDFVTWRVNWNDKADNIRSIAEELGLALETFLFIDDSPVERERVRQFLPQVEVWGENPFALRRKLLSDPRLQLPRITAESAGRTELTKAQLGRQAAKSDMREEDFLASLKVETRFARLGKGAELERVSELFQRTTQFNTTGVKFAASELEALAASPNAAIFVAHVKDRFGDHGLVGAAVLQDGEIAGLVLSCRVLGLGVEHRFVQYILSEPGRDRVTGRIIATDRNNPVRNIYRDNGFVLNGEVWERAL